MYLIIGHTGLTAKVCAFVEVMENWINVETSKNGSSSENDLT